MGPNDRTNIWEAFRAAKEPVLPWATQSSFLAKGKTNTVLVVFTSLCGSNLIKRVYAYVRDGTKAGMRCLQQMLSCLLLTKNEYLFYRCSRSIFRVNY